MSEMVVQPFPEVIDRTDAERERLLGIARAEFVAHGFQRTTIRDIALRSGVSRITINRRCGDKNQIIVAVVQRELDVVFRELAVAVAPLEEPTDRAVEIFVRGWLQTQSHPLVAALLRYEPQSVTKLLTGEDGVGVMETGRIMWASLLAGKGCPQVAAVECAELLVRITTSLLLLPSAQFSLENENSARRFARKYLVPIAEASLDRGT